MARKIKRSGLNVERLESRAMLAGDVTVRVVAGKLEIEGDGLDNTIAIAAGATAGAFLVTGTGTTINGSSAALPAFTGVTAGIEVEMNAGNDSVTFGAVTVPQDLDIETGIGNDTVTLNANLNVAGELNIETGLDNDTVTATTITVGRLEIETGAGNDTVSLTGVTINQVATGNLSNSKIGLAEIETGDGTDSVTINGLTAKRLRVNTGDGADTANIKATVDRLSVKLSKGSDSLTLSATAAIANRLSLRGGSGTDTLTNNLTNPPATLKRIIRGFENGV